MGRRTCLAYRLDYRSSAELVIFRARPSQADLRARTARGLGGIGLSTVERIPHLGELAFVGSGSPKPRPGEAAPGPSVSVLMLVGRDLYFLFASNTTVTRSEAVAIARGVFAG